MGAKMLDPEHMPNPTDATDDDLGLACEAIGANARYGGMLSAALAGIYAERSRTSRSHRIVLPDPDWLREDPRTGRPS